MARGGPGRVGNTRGEQGRVGLPLERSGTGRGTLEQVRDGSRDHQGGPEQVVVPRGGTRWDGGPSRRFGTGLGTQPKDREGSGDPR